MKKILFLVLLFPVLAFGQTLKVLTWNVFMLPKPINFTLQQKRAKLMVEQLAASDADVIVLQEAFSKASRNKFENGLKKNFPYQAVLKKSKRIRYLLGPGLFVASRYPLEILDHVYFNNCTTSDCFASKGALLVEVTLPNGKKVQIATTHLQAWNTQKSVDIRGQQIDEIKELMSRHIETDVPQILAGDLNINGRLDIEYKVALARSGMSSEELKGELNATNGFGCECYKTPGGVHEGQWLDHVWLYPRGTTTKVLDRQVKTFFGKIKEKLCPLSDHHGVEATIQL